MSRYAAKLLFQFRFDNEGKNALRKIERRIVIFKAEDAGSAYAVTKSYAKNEEFCFVNDCGIKAFLSLSELKTSCNWARKRMSTKFGMRSEK